MKPHYRVMRQDDGGLMRAASGDYKQRASAFKQARRVAQASPGRHVTVWEHAGPGTSRIHVVQSRNGNSRP